MRVSVQGIGWIQERTYGCVLQGRKESCESDALLRKSLFPSSVRHFGRFNRASRLTCCAVALALRDAGLAHEPGARHAAGIISSGPSGCFETDREYFADYLESGRVLGRGNLFIYTLPSSPAGEAAIHFGLQGPLMYVADQQGDAALAVRIAVDVIAAHESPHMLAGMTGEDHSLFFYLSGEGSGAGKALLSADDVLKTVCKGRKLTVMVEKLAGLRQRNVTA